MNRYICRGCGTQINTRNKPTNFVHGECPLTRLLPILNDGLPPKNQRVHQWIEAENFDWHEFDEDYEVAKSDNFVKNTGNVLKRNTSFSKSSRDDKDSDARQRATESDERLFDSIKKLFLYKSNKLAKSLHIELEGIEADIRIAFSNGDNSKASELIRQLKHDSNFFIPKTNTSYRQYWTKKREQLLDRL